MTFIKTEMKIKNENEIWKLYNTTSFIFKDTSAVLSADVLYD